MINIQIQDNPQFFNWLREHYAELSFSDLKHIYRELENLSPNQPKTNINFIIDCFNEIMKRIGDKFTVAELGCHNGLLASIFCAYKNVKWIGYDICDWTNQINQCNNGFSFRELDKQIWMLPKSEFRGCDVFLSSHTVEHFSDSEIEKLIGFIKHFRFAALIIPLLKDKINWENYHGAHFLSEGYDSFKTTLGYKTILEELNGDGSWMFLGEKETS